MNLLGARVYKSKLLWCIYVGVCPNLWFSLIASF